MSRIDTVEASCPECSRPQPVTLYHSINVSVTPNLKDELFREVITVAAADPPFHVAVT